MKVYTHFSVLGFSNTYLVGPEEGGDAILIDPGVMDIPLLKLIESNGYYIRHILVTHNHESHVRGGGTLLKIYAAKVYGSARNLLDRDSRQVSDGEVLHLSGMEVECLEIPGHSSDSMVYRIGTTFFTGDALNAGGIGSTPNRYARALLIQAIRRKIFSWEQGVIFPGHGPPTTLRTEQRFNPDLLGSEEAH